MLFPFGVRFDLCRTALVAPFWVRAEMPGNRPPDQNTPGTTLSAQSHGAAVAKGAEEKPGKM